MRKATRRDDQSERGAVLVMTAAAMILLLAMAAMAIDVGWLLLNGSRAKHAAEAAALAGVVHIHTEEAEAFGVARAIAAANGYVDGSLGGSANVNPSRIADNENRLRVQVTAPVGTFFMKAFGIHTVDLTREATAEFVPLPLLAGPRFLIDHEMFDTDVPAIEQLARSLGTTTEALLTDADGDWFIDMPAGAVLELPTGQLGDEGIFDIRHPAYPFSDTSVPSQADFFNYNDAPSWRNDLVPTSMLDPLLGAVPIVDPAGYAALVDPELVHIEPVFISDLSVLNPVGGVPAVNALAARRGVVAIRVLAVGADPDGAGSQLPNLVVEIVDPALVTFEPVPPGSRAAPRPHLVF